MKNKGSTFEGLVILAGLCIVIFVFILPPRRPSPQRNFFTLSDTQESWRYAGKQDSGGNSKITSSFGQSITLSSGNASYATQSYEEYVTIRNNSNSRVSITGWKLENNKNGAATIPQGTNYISPTGVSRLQNIVLLDGDEAIVTTGSIGSRSPYVITSFKENMCSGYLEEMPEYDFNPPLRRECPDPSKEPGVSGLDRQCRDFINSLGSCEIPEFGGRDRNGESCPNCVNGVPLSSSCRSFIQSHYSYAGCIANHASDPDFSSRTWRIFLGRGWEMWDKDVETISLYDQFGRLVDYINY